MPFPWPRTLPAFHQAEGFAWDLVKALAGRYNLPPLLVSDLLGVENTEVLENFGAGSGVGGSGGGSSDPGPAPGGAGGFDGTWASGTSMPRGRATARSGLMGRRSRNAPAQLLSRSSQLGSGSWEKSGGVYGGGNAGDGIGGGGTDGGGGSGGSGAAGCGAWWRWGRIEKEEEPQLEDPHRRIKTEYYGWVPWECNMCVAGNLFDPGLCAMLHKHATCQTYTATGPTASCTYPCP
mgnify:CR=1 FL=1